MTVNRMKKIFNCFFAAAIVSCLLTTSALAQKPLRVVTTFYPMYIMALNIARDVPGVSVTNLTPPVTGCLHDYALTTRDMKKLADADILIANGAGMESFLEDVIKQFPSLKIIYAFNPKGKVNPHFWVSLEAAMGGVRRISSELGQFDPRHAADYNRNAEEYVAKLTGLKVKMKFALAAYQGQRIVTFHEAFPYFAEEFGFEIAAVVEREPGSTPSARELAETIDLVKEKGVRVLFVEPQYSPSAAEMIGRETGAKILTLDPAVTGPTDPDAYLKIMEGNLKSLQEAFQ